jgi:hypothetical protein
MPGFLSVDESRDNQARDARILDIEDGTSSFGQQQCSHSKWVPVVVVIVVGLCCLLPATEFVKTRDGTTKHDDNEADKVGFIAARFQHKKGKPLKATKVSPVIGFVPNTLYTPLTPITKLGDAASSLPQCCTQVPVGADLSMMHRIPFYPEHAHEASFDYKSHLLCVAIPKKFCDEQRGDLIFLSLQRQSHRMANPLADILRLRNDDLDLGALRSTLTWSWQDRNELK